MTGKQAPDLAPIGFGRPAIGARHAQIGQRHPLGTEHAEHIVIGRHEELRGIGKRRVLGIPARIGMAMRTYDRQVPHPVIKRAGQIAGAPLRREKPVLIHQCHASPHPPMRIKLVLAVIV